MAADQGVSRSPSLYRKVAEDIKAAIAAGGYAAGTRLPSESELAERYLVSRGTIRQAFAALRADGVIASRRGARRVVIGGPRVQSFGELLSFSRWARAMGEAPGGRVVTLQRGPSKPAEAERLAIPPGEPIYRLVRVRLLSGRPVMVERGAYPDQVGELVAGMDLETGSITERLEELGIVFADAEHVIDAVPASAQDARLLGVSPRVPMLRERRLTTDPAGAPVEWSDDRYLGSAVAFSVHNSTAVNALSRTPAGLAAGQRHEQGREVRERRRGGGLVLGLIVPAAYRHRVAGVPDRLERRRLGRGHRATLQGQGADRFGRQYPDVTGVDGAQIPFGRHVQPHRLGHRLAEPLAQPPRARLAVPRFRSQRRGRPRRRPVLPLAEQVPDVMQQGRGHQRGPRPGRLGQRPGLPHVLADGHRLAEVVTRPRPGEQLPDSFHRDHGVSFRRVPPRESSPRVSTASVLASPSRSA
jgi:GntR family transcriptional regulator